jgi:L-rhamnose isomerase / sugar isomerase
MAKGEYDLLVERLTGQGIDVGAVETALKEQKIETPSWGYANSGTRFKTFGWPGAARTTQEKLDDAAMVQKMTGVAPSVAIHIPWDTPADGDFVAMRQYAESKGVVIGAVNPNLFQDDEYRLGSLANPNATVRSMAQEISMECCDIMQKVGSKLLSMWLADGTNYAGQDSLRQRKHRLLDGLKMVYSALPRDSRMLVEYKLFEPAFYSTDLPDWGTSLTMCQHLGSQAQVLVDLGHHASGVNIEQIVAFLLDEGRLGGFHFNNRKYADDDLIVGSVNPFELFLIYNELVDAEQSSDEPARTTAQAIAYMIDQSHAVEGKMSPMIYSVMNCQEAYAKALLVQRGKLAQVQQSGEVIAAHALLNDAFRVDVRPLLAKVREELGVPADPLAAYRASGYEEKIVKVRGLAANLGGYQ